MRIRTQKIILIVIWLLHAVVFLHKKNFYPVMYYDLFSYTDNFGYRNEKIIALKTHNQGEPVLDLTSEFVGNSYWRFFVVAKKLIQEDPDFLSRNLLLRFQTIQNNDLSDYKYLQYRATLVGDPVVLFEVTLE